MQLAGGTETGKVGYTYDVTVGGTQDLGSGNITFDVNDQVVLGSDGTWTKRDFTDAVTSVHGRIGAVVAVSGDYDADEITETNTRYFAIKHNRNAVVAPTATDDSTANYSVGSEWFDSVSGISYVCQDATASNAIWIVASGAGGTGGTDVFFVERFETNEASDITDTGNGTTLIGGVLAGAIANEEVSQIKGDRSIKYTQASGSLDDFFFLP